MFQFFLVTPEKIVFNDIIHALIVPGTAGYFEILKDHAAIISSLTIGKLVIIDKNKHKTNWAITGGVIEVIHNKATLLADAIEKSSDIDVKRAEAAQQKAKKHLNSNDADVDMLRAKIAMQRAANRLKIAAYINE